MVLLAKLLLPDRDRNGKQSKIPIAQLSLAACLKWLNPRRAAAGLAIYSDALDAVKSLPIPPVERLRSEIIDAVQNNTFTQNVVDEPMFANTNRYTDAISITIRKLTMENMLPYTDIWTASYYDRLQEVEHYVVACGMDVNIVQFGHPYQTPLHYAASGGAISALIHLVDVHGNSPIHMAARWGRVEILEEIMRAIPVHEKAWCNLNRMGQSPKVWSITYGHKEVHNFFQLHFPEKNE
ncbi:hypothetical protein THRCLA_07478 [Thraustotheca clavata]|uniref:Uncharacterized protein n=1 Tax=Thraustotheca clavata TaxID=74557 RepID=A0A1V9ZD40_9STRA|nr:hypothetical protein THRCLA_07478 [Thraustotheca clavata]